MRKLRLLLWKDCNRDCKGCCNKGCDLDKLEVETDFTKYKEIYLTGGEPMIDPEYVDLMARALRRVNKKVKIYLYTADVRNTYAFLKVLRVLNGATITLHSQNDVKSIRDLVEIASSKTMSKTS